jgi:nucleoside-diphosphate-sugar epimerase
VRTIAIVGASGFVGSTLVERLLAKGGDHVLPFIHSSGNAWRLARLDMDLRTLDLLDKADVERSLQGVTHVVNCSRGGDEVMLAGLDNLLAASRKVGVARFIQLSSVAVYGDPPHPQSSIEEAPTDPIRGTYGWTKLQQDRAVEAASRNGLSSVILCPPNISGPYSPYLIGLVDALRSGAFALLDDGGSPCNLVDVSNLCAAIELAMSGGPANGARLFVTDDEGIAWKSVIDHLRPLTESSEDVPVLSREQLLRLDRTEARRGSLWRSLKHLVSSDVRQAIRKDPLWESLDSALRRGVTRLGRNVENTLRISIEGPIKVTRASDVAKINARLCKQQLREVTHSCEAAKQQLSYRPLHSFAESMNAFRDWYRQHHGMDSSVWPLLRQLY